MHAIGDKAVNEALNAVNTSSVDGFYPRHRLTHVELVRESDLPRFRDLGVIADAQVNSQLFKCYFLLKTFIFCTVGYRQFYHAKRPGSQVPCSACR
jgi:predicted amidohydrolase YtcJ